MADDEIGTIRQETFASGHSLWAYLPKHSPVWDDHKHRWTCIYSTHAGNIESDLATSDVEWLLENTAVIGAVPGTPAAAGRIHDADALHTAVVASLKTTASELHARPPEEMNRDWADRMADGLAAAGLLAAHADSDSHRVTAELAAGMQGITRLVGLDPESGEIGPTVERVAALVTAGLPAKRCPRCDSPDPAKHPAVQFEGEVSICPDQWHSPAAPADDEAVVERVAKAIYASDRAEGDTPFTLDWEDFESDSKPHERYYNRARAALAALRGEQ
jgi:hypothetical protein